MYCVKCGREVVDNARFCVSCGAPIEAVQPAEAELPIYQPTQPQPEPVETVIPAVPVEEPTTGNPAKKVFSIVSFSSSMLVLVLLIAEVFGAGLLLSAGSIVLGFMGKNGGIKPLAILGIVFGMILATVATIAVFATN